AKSGMNPQNHPIDLRNLLRSLMFLEFLYFEFLSFNPLKPFFLSINDHFKNNHFLFHILLFLHLLKNYFHLFFVSQIQLFYVYFHPYQILLYHPC
ncbi:hypothetical protein M153_69070003, partial [Pseudoloma neurophilia]